jgi:hypothetical protein
MSTTQTNLFPPPTRTNAVDSKGFLAIPLRQWLFSLQMLLPLRVGDTSKGSYSEALPPAGLNQTTGQSNQNEEIIYIKGSADANTWTITGAISGSVTLSAQYQLARFKSDGTNWWNVGVSSGATSLSLEVNGTPNADQALLNLFAGYGITLTDAGAGKIVIAASGGSGFPSGSTLFTIPPANGQNTGTNGHTLVLKMPAGMLTAIGNGGVKVKLMTGNAGPFIVAAAAIGATVANYIDPGAISGFVPNYAWTSGPTALTWPGGSFGSTTTAYASNPCAIDIDSDHDYYVLIYIDPSSEGSVPLFAATSDPVWAYIGGIISGNHTADADASAFSGGGMLFDGVNGVVSVNLA